jgi:opacity protein-like surface antigen
MKKQLLFVALVLLAASQLSAQSDIKRIGGLLAYGTNNLSIGFGAVGEFSVAEKITIAPNFTYFLGKSVDTGLGTSFSYTAWALGADARYYFTSEESLSIYGLAGLAYNNITVPSISFFGQTSSSSSSGKIGLDFGAGAVFGAGNLSPFAELKYNTAFESLVIGAGVMFPLGK